MRKKYSIRIFSARLMHWILLLAFINNIIEVPSINCDAAYNEQETLYEWVAEELMNIDNAVPENEDSDAEKLVLKKTTDWINFFLAMNPSSYGRFLSIGSCFITAIYINPLFELNTPPPEFRA